MSKALSRFELFTLGVLVFSTLVFGFHLSRQISLRDVFGDEDYDSAINDWPSQPLAHRIAITQFDPDTKVAKLAIKSVFDRNKIDEESVENTLSGENSLPPAAGYNVSDEDEFPACFRGLMVDDLGSDVQAVGTLALGDATPIQRNEQEALDEYEELKEVNNNTSVEDRISAFETENRFKVCHKQPAEPTNVDVTALGDPAEFPVDKYLVIVRVHEPVIITYEVERAPIALPNSRSIGFDLAGFRLRPATQQDFAKWNTEDASKGRSHVVDPDEPQMNESYWGQDGVCVLIYRPPFLRYFAIFLLGVALVGTTAVGLTTKQDAALVNLTGMFLSIWSMRSVAAAWAPKTPSYIDRAAIALFCWTILLLSARLTWTWARSKISPAPSDAPDEEDIIG